MKKFNKGIILLLATAFIWASAFMFQSDATKYVGPFTFNMFRAIVTALGFSVSLAVSKLFKKSDEKEIEKKDNKLYIVYGVMSGILFFGACTLQQYGLEFTTIGKAGFLTSTQVLIVPLLSLFMGVKIKPKVWICIGVCLVGFFIMNYNGTLTINIGDLLIFGCAIFYSMQVILCSKVSQKVNYFKYGIVFSVVLALLSFVFAIIFEKITISSLKEAIIDIIYVGLISGVFSTILQLKGQKTTTSSIAALILSMQSIFSLSLGVFIMKDDIPLYENIGAMIAFFAIAFSIIEFKKIKKKSSE